MAPRRGSSAVSLIFLWSIAVPAAPRAQDIPPDVESSAILQDQASARSWAGERLGDAVGKALLSSEQFYKMRLKALAKPVRAEELRAAVLSQDGVRQIQQMFDRVMEQRLLLGSKVVLAEIGGEATLDGTVRFNEVVDRTRPVRQLLARARDDEKEIARLYAAHPREMREIDEGDALRNTLERLARIRAKGRSEEFVRNLVRGAVDTVLEGSGNSYIYSFEALMETLSRKEWSGRYAGRWHLHPPVFLASGGWEAGEGPSGADLELARSGGRLVISFQLDGFDVYDLDGLKNDRSARIDYSKIRKISHRSPEWARHFKTQHWILERQLAATAR